MPIIMPLGVSLECNGDVSTTITTAVLLWIRIASASAGDGRLSEPEDYGQTPEEVVVHNERYPHFLVSGDGL
jgi:hypothetical protein